MTNLRDPIFAISGDEVPNWRTDLRPGIYVFRLSPESRGDIISIKAGALANPKAPGISVVFLKYSEDYHFYDYPLTWIARLYYPTNDDIAEAVRLKMTRRKQP